MFHTLLPSMEILKWINVVLDEIRCWSMLPTSSTSGTTDLALRRTTSRRVDCLSTWCNTSRPHKTTTSEKIKKISQNKNLIILYLWVQGEQGAGVALGRFAQAAGAHGPLQGRAAADGRLLRAPRLPPVARLPNRLVCLQPGRCPPQVLNHK